MRLWHAEATFAISIFDAMRNIEVMHHEAHHSWPFCREQLFTAEVLDVEDTESAQRLFDQAVACELGFEVFQIADAWRLPQGFVWQ